MVADLYMPEPLLNVRYAHENCILISSDNIRAVVQYQFRSIEPNFHGTHPLKNNDTAPTFNCQKLSAQ